MYIHIGEIVSEGKTVNHSSGGAIYRKYLPTILGQNET